MNIYQNIYKNPDIKTASSIFCKESKDEIDLGL